MNFFVLTFLYYCIVLFLYYFHPFGTDSELLRNILYNTFGGAATLIGLIMLAVMGFFTQRTRSLLLLVTGIGCWFVGDVLWAIEQMTTGSITFPAIADYSYLLGYITLFAGILLEIRFANIAFKKMNKGMLLGIGLFATVMSIIFVYISMYLSYSPDASLWENIITIGYGVGDIILVISTAILFMLVWEYRGGKLAIAWGLLGISFMFVTIADIIYGIFTDSYLIGGAVKDIADTLYMGGNLLVGYSFYVIYSFTKKIQRKVLKISH